VLIVTFHPRFILREKERMLSARRPDIAQRTVAAS